MAGSYKGMMYHSYFIKDLMEPKPAKTNNKTMKYRVKTKVLNGLSINDTVECRNGLCECKGSGYTFEEGIIERNPDWFEPVEEIQKGDYVFRVWPSGTKTFGRVTDGGYGNESKFFLAIEPYEEEGGASAGRSYGWGDYEYDKATTDEIEQALKEEAKRRGLAPGNKVKTPCGFEYTLSGNPYEYKYKADLDRLYSSGVLIYDNGEFAELVDQTPDIEINGNKVEFNDHPKVGCTTIKKEVFIEQAKTIARHGVRVHRKGEDITDQILAIASYYGYETDLSNTIGETVQLSGTIDGSVTWGFSSENMWGNND